MRRGILLISVVWASCAAVSCVRGEPAKTSVPPVAPVVVPAPTQQTAESSPALPPRVEQDPGPDEETTEARASFEVRVDSDGGKVVIHSTPDSGVQVWGTFHRKDGGFSFSGGFSTGVDASAP